MKFLFPKIFEKKSQKIAWAHSGTILEDSFGRLLGTAHLNLTFCHLDDHLSSVTTLVTPQNIILYLNIKTLQSTAAVRRTHVTFMNLRGWFIQLFNSLA